MIKAIIGMIITAVVKFFGKEAIRVAQNPNDLHVTRAPHRDSMMGYAFEERTTTVIEKYQTLTRALVLGGVLLLGGCQSRIVMPSPEDTPEGVIWIVDEDEVEIAAKTNDGETVTDEHVLAGFIAMKPEELRHLLEIARRYQESQR